MKFTVSLKPLSIIILLVFSLTPLFSQTFDWNLGTGGNVSRNGLSEALGPLVALGTAPDLYWSGGEYAAFAGYPVIEGDNLIVYRRLASSPSTESWIINYNVYTGVERWRIQLPIDTYHNYSKVSAVNNGVVYANRAGGTSEPEYIYALDITTGAVIWKSEDVFGEHNTETVTFTDNGDIIASDGDKISRINKDDGTTIWSFSRPGSSSDGNAVSAYGDRGYFWGQNSMGMFVGVCDLVSGAYLYPSQSLGSPGFQQGCLMVGPDGTVYAPFIRGNDSDSLFALIDDGDSLTNKWSYPICHATFGNHGVGPDSTVYTYSRDERIVRLHPETGVVIDSSIVVSDGNSFFSSTMAVGDDGMVYATVTDYPFAKTYIFTQDLEYLWGEEIYGVRGVALGDSVLVVNGKSTEIRAYMGRSNPTSIEIENQGNIHNSSIICSPNPFSSRLSITYSIPEAAEVELSVYDLSGRLVETLEAGSTSSGEHIRTWTPESSLPDGCFLIVLNAGGERTVRRCMRL
ncbi:MAG: PQQ-binding-like beta-propeller repeat protein [Candidatus Fermentibacteria bacterium]